MLIVGVCPKTLKEQSLDFKSLEVTCYWDLEQCAFLALQKTVDTR